MKLTKFQIDRLAEMDKAIANAHRNVTVLTVMRKDLMALFRENWRKAQEKKRAKRK